MLVLGERRQGVARGEELLAVEARGGIAVVDAATRTMTIDPPDGLLDL